MPIVEIENTGDDKNGDHQNKLFLACARGDPDVPLTRLSPEWIEPRHLSIAIGRSAPIPEIVRWLLDTLPLSLIQNYRDPDTDLTPMEVLCQTVLAQEEWQRYHKEKRNHIEMNWECVRLLAIKQLECHPETPTLHACLQLHLLDSSRMPFSLLQQALRKFSHQALVVDPSGRVPLHIALSAVAARRRRVYSTRAAESVSDSDDESNQELFSLLEKVLKLNPTAARERDPEDRLPLDVAIATECHDLSCQLAQCYPAGLGIRRRFPSSLVFCVLLRQAPLDVSFAILREVSNYLD